MKIGEARLLPFADLLRAGAQGGVTPTHGEPGRFT